MFAADTLALTRAEVAARWRAFLADASFDELPEGFRVEMDAHGELILSPRPTNRHQIIAELVSQQLQRQLGGFATGTGVTINTRIGVRVPDVIWTADADPSRLLQEDPAPGAPEICVEIASPSNTRKWLQEKAAAYLEAGAREVILVEAGGRIRYFDASGELPASGFGIKLELPSL